ncbi:AraC family transcriptional regulator [Streptomyces sp. NPDC093544]|uniref:AraC family transcriptional regulator n=1 Tax=Streptomyces sp. NPDC093544 TaxID=3155200 RepID=UPI003413D319
MEVQQAQTVVLGSVVTRDVDEIRAALATSFSDAWLDVRGDAGDFVAKLAFVDLGTLTVGRVSYGTQITGRTSEVGCYNVAVPITGSFSTRQGRGPVSYAGHGRAVVRDPAGDNLVDDWSPDCEIFNVRVDKALLVRQLETLLGRPVHRRPVLAPAFDVSSGPGRSWVNLVSWCLLEREVPQGLLRQPMFAGRIEQALLEGLLLASDHQYREALEAPPPSMRPAAVKRVMDAVREHPADPYDAAKLAAIAQVSLRTLQDAFRKNLGMSPMNYVHEVRLQRVREQLLLAVPGTVTVTDVAYQWGFAHLGRFAQRYRARFGEAPSQTLQSAA